MMIAFLPSSKLDHGLVKLKSPEGEINKIHFMAAADVLDRTTHYNIWQRGKQSGALSKQGVEF